MEIYCGICEDNGESPMQTIQDSQVIRLGRTIAYKCPRCESAQETTNG